MFQTTKRISWLQLFIVSVSVATIFAFTVFLSSASAAGASQYTTNSGPTYVSGTITTDTTWTVENSPYVLTDFGVSVGPEATLTIEPGVTIMGEQNAMLNVEGHLEAVGAPLTPITFTSTVDSGPGQWWGVWIYGTGHLNHTVIRYAETNFSVATATGDQVILENSTIAESSNYAVLVSLAALHRLEMNNVTFTNNVINRVFLSSGEGAVLQENVMLQSHAGLEGYEFHNESSGYNELVIPSGVTLTLDAGVTLMAGDGHFWNAVVVEPGGHLEAIGTEAEPVIFTSATDSGPSTWQGILTEGTTNLTHAVIRNADFTLLVRGSTGGMVRVSDSLISSNYYGAAAGLPALHRLELSNVTFQSNTYNQVILDYELGNTLTAAARLTRQPGLDGYLWSSSSAPTLTIPSGVTLTVEPGVTLTADNPSSQIVIEPGGYLEAIGMPSRPITFTSLAASSGGDWEGIYTNGGTGKFAHVVVEHARLPFNVDDGHLELADSIITGGSGSTHGVQVTNGEVDITCTRVNGRQGAAVYVGATGNADVVLRTSEVSGNTDGVVNEGHAVVDARYNWWGDASGPGGDGAGSGDSVRGKVLYRPWQGEPGCGLMHIRGGVVTDTTWTTVEGPYVLAGDVTVAPTATLTIEPGVTIMGEDAAHLLVEGHLEAIGTPSMPISFTSQLDSGSGQWGGIWISGTAQLDYTLIRYADTNLRVAAASDGPVVLQNSAIAGSHEDALVVLQNSTIAGSHEDALSVSIAALHRLELSNVTFQDNYNNQVVLDAEEGDALSGNVRLTPQTGLDGYRWADSVPTLTIPSGVSLTVEPGVTLMAGNSLAQIDVEEGGHLDVLGTSSEPIVFRPAASGSDEWEGVRVLGGGVQFTHVTMEQARVPFNVRGGQLDVAHSVIARGSSDGVQVYDGEVDITCTSISQRQAAAVYVAAGGSPDVVVRGSELDGNASGIVNESDATVDARYNWWGDATGPSGDGAGNGDSLQGNVLYEPWLEAPECISETPEAPVFNLYLPFLVSESVSTSSRPGGAQRDLHGAAIAVVSEE